LNEKQYDLPVLENTGLIAFISFIFMFRQVISENAKNAYKKRTGIRELTHMPTLNVQKGYDKSSVIKLTSGEFIIGRDPTCNLPLDSGDVSRRHSRIIVDGGHVSIEDMDSSNGTFVNSSPIDGRYELKHMDVVQIGGNVIVFNNADSSTGLDTADFARKTGMRTSEYYTPDFMSLMIKRIEANIKKVFKGKDEVIRNVLVCLFADGHLLIEDIPGVGKSMIAQTLAKSIQGTYKRIQFTPDMLPSDITGINIYDANKGEFNFLPGPVFGNIILADEINRTTPRTQSSMLECMSDSVITIDGRPHVLPKPFFVIATQNPSDYHGTYPLPEPQLDRFLMRISIGYPEKEAEKEILTSQMKQHPINEISFVVKATEILQCHSLVRQVHVSEPIKEYILNIADATRKHPSLATGGSPRASLALMRAGQSFAAYYARQYVIPRDIRELVPVVLGHRISMKLRSQGEFKNTFDVLKDILEKIPVPEEEKKL
jgi:MoxR-like ATPase